MAEHMLRREQDGIDLTLTQTLTLALTQTLTLTLSLTPTPTQVSKMGVIALTRVLARDEPALLVRVRDRVRDRVGVDTAGARRARPTGGQGRPQPCP